LVGGGGVWGVVEGVGGFWSCLELGLGPNGL